MAGWRTSLLAGMAWVGAAFAAPPVALVPSGPNAYLTEHALFLVADPAQVSFPGWSSVYSNANVATYVAELKARFPDDFLMVVVAANNLTPAMTPNVVTYRKIADGIGQNGINGVGVPNICRYHIGTSATVFEPAFSVLDHEVGHNWGVQIGIEVGSGHWYGDPTAAPFVATTVTGQMAATYTDDGYVTVKQVSGNPQAGFTWSAIDNLARNDTETYSDQDLYAMGLHPVFPDTYVLSAPVYNADHTVSYSNVVKYDHAWALGKNGPRLPGHAASEKRFRMGFVYVARDVAEVMASYAAVERSIAHFVDAEQVDTAKYRFQVPFLVATKNRATIRARLADLDGNASPALALTGPAHVDSTDGTASFAFAAMDPDGPAPAVSLVPPSPYGYVGAGTVSFSGLPAGTHFFTLKAQDAGGKKDFAHFVVDVAPYTPSVFNDPQLFVAQQYRDFLGREGDAAGIQFYVDLLRSNAITREQVIESFLASPEFALGLPPVTRLYFSFFNRIPDYAGLMFQAAAFRAGTPLEAIAQNFYSSPEFTNTYGALDNDSYITLVYQNVLGRAPDAGGFAFYRNLLDNNVISKGQMMIGFSESPEFRALTDNEAWVISVYAGLLRRTPEPAGLAFYAGLLDGGTPRSALIPGFHDSPEYRNRFLP